MTSNAQFGGGRLATLPFAYLPCVDFEFYQTRPGDRPTPLCMVVADPRAHAPRRYWADELQTMKQAPFPTGETAAMVAFYAPAELNCMAALGWPPPHNVIDLYVENRVETNGANLSGLTNSLLDALALRGIPHITSEHKQSTIDLILSGRIHSTEQRLQIIKYCESDVRALCNLLDAMAPTLDVPRALLRGRYMKAVANMENNGVPIDTRIHSALVQEWPRLRQRLINATAVDFGIYEGTTFKQARFKTYLKSKNMEWPVLPSGQFDLKDETFAQQIKRYPHMQPIHELRQLLGKRNPAELPVGSDGRNRAMLSPFRSVTGRNQPSTSKFIFGHAKCVRCLIKPEEGTGAAYIDFKCQEIGLAAALSGDERMIAAYLEGDPYLAFAKQAGLVPEDATKDSHPLIRERCKQVVLGLNYGMGPAAMAVSAGITESEALELLNYHRRTYPRFWRWMQASVDSAVLTGQATSVFGWSRRTKSSDKATSLMNFPMQANGAEMMRIAAIKGAEAGIEICAPVHDAFFIVAPLDRLEDDVAQMRKLMSRAGATVANGLAIGTDAQLVRYPDRYVDAGGAAMWNRIVGLVGFDSARVSW